MNDDTGALLGRLMEIGYARNRLDDTDPAFRDALIQMAATAVAWIERIERDLSVDPGRQTKPTITDAIAPNDCLYGLPGAETLYDDPATVWDPPGDG